MPKITFVLRDGTRYEVDAPLGLSVLEVAHKHGVDLEGACEGSLACATCHVIVDPAWIDRLVRAVEDEEDMLDRAFGLEQTSRLPMPPTTVAALLHTLDAVESDQVWPSHDWPPLRLDGPWAVGARGGHGAARAISPRP